MNERIKELAEQAMGTRKHVPPVWQFYDIELAKFAKSLVEAVLDEVEQRAYYTGDRDWSDELDRRWIQLEFGYGPIHDAKHDGV